MLHNDMNYISNSEVQAFKRCRRKWYLGWHLGLSSRFEDYSSLMRSGTRIHKVLAKWYIPDVDPDSNLMAVLDVVQNEDRTAIYNAYPKADEVSNDYVESSLTTALAEFEKIVAYERAMIEGYLEWIEETGVDSELVPITTEQEIVLAHVEFPIKFVGIVDALMWNKEHNGLVFLDHKTVQSLTQPIPTLRMNEQMLHYIYLLQSVTQERIIGAEYNMIRRVKRTAASKPPYYDRVFIDHSPVEIEAYRKHLYAVSFAIWRASQHLIDAGDHEFDLAQQYMYPSPTMNCSWDCPFFSVCPMFDDGSDVKRMLEYQYVKGNPLERYESINVLKG